MPVKKLTDEQWKQCEEMRAKAMYYSEIADTFGVSLSCIRSHFQRPDKTRIPNSREINQPGSIETNTERHARRKAAVTRFIASLNIGDTVRIQEGACEKKHKDRKVQGKVMYKDKNKFTLQKKNSRETFEFNYLMMANVKVAKVKTA